MKIVVIGAGGIGGYIGGRLAQAGHKVSLLARGAHLQAMLDKGLKIESPSRLIHLENIHATDDISKIGTVDVVLVAVKMPDLEAISSQLHPLLSSTTRVITTQNGIAAKTVLAQHIDPAIIAQSIIYLAAYITEPGTVYTPGGKHIMIAEHLNRDSILTEFFAAFEDTYEMDADTVGDGDHLIWTKFAAQSAIAAVTCLTRMSLGGVFACPDAQNLLRRLMEEAITVAEACGVKLESDYIAIKTETYRQQPEEQSSSLLLDFIAGKPSELEWMSGHIHRLGIEHSIPTPAHSVAWQAFAAYRNGTPKFAM